MLDQITPGLMLLLNQVRWTPITGSPQFQTPSIVASNCWPATRRAQVGKSGELRTLTAMPILASAGFV